MNFSTLSLKRLFFLAAALLGLFGILAAGTFILPDPYTLYVDGQVLTVNGQFDTVAGVVTAAGITLRPADRVNPPLSEPIAPEIAIQVQRARAVSLRTESESRTWWTHQPTLGAFLLEAGIRPQRTDQIHADGEPIAFQMLDQTPLPQTVEIGKFVTVTIFEGEDRRVLRTAAQTVGAALQEAGISLYATDGVEPPPGNWLTPNMQIRVRRSMPLFIRVDGRLIETRSHHTNALDVLAESGIGLVGQDYTIPGAGTTLHENDTIEVVRVTEDFRIDDRPIPYETQWQASDQLELDSRALLQSGVPGILRQRIRVRYENGVVTGETPDGEWIAQEPVPEILGYGTNVVVRALETSDGYYEYWRVVRMRVTSYTAASSGKAPDHPAYGITASGLRAGTGIVAVDPRVVPFRTWVYVPGYGTGFAGDTGGGVKGRWIDLGYDQRDYQSWSGYIDVYYLTPVPDPADINYLIPTTLP